MGYLNQVSSKSMDIHFTHEKIKSILTIEGPWSLKSRIHELLQIETVRI